MSESLQGRPNYLMPSQLYTRPSPVQLHHVLKHTKSIRYTVTKTYSQPITEKSVWRVDLHPDFLLSGALSAVDRSSQTVSQETPRAASAISIPVCCFPLLLMCVPSFFVYRAPSQTAQRHLPVRSWRARAWQRERRIDERTAVPFQQTIKISEPRRCSHEAKWSPVIVLSACYRDHLQVHSLSASSYTFSIWPYFIFSFSTVNPVHCTS